MRAVRWGVLPVLLLSSMTSSLFAQGQRRSPEPNLGEHYTVELEIRRWRADLASELRLSANGLPGSTVDPIEDLELPADRGFDFRIGVRLARRLRLRGAWVKFDYQGETTPGQDLSIAGLRAPAGSTLETALELEQIRGGAEFDILRGLYGFVAVVGEYGRFEARPRFEANGADVEPEPLRIELPLFGLKGRVYLTPALSLTAEATGMKRESEGVRTEVDAVATYNLIPNLAISYGYRNSYNRVKSVEPAGDRAVFRLRGQYVSVTVRF